MAEEKNILKNLKNLFQISTLTIVLSVTMVFTDTKAVAGVVMTGVISAADNANFSDPVGADIWHGIREDGMTTGVKTAGPENNFAITLGRKGCVNADRPINIKAVNVNGFGGTKKVDSSSILATQNISLGSVIDTSLNKSLATLVFNAPDLDIILTGDKSVAAYHGFTTKENQYDALGVISFNNNNGILTVNAENKELISIGNNNQTEDTIADVGANSVINIDTPLQTYGSNNNAIINISNNMSYTMVQRNNEIPHEGPYLKLNKIDNYGPSSTFIFDSEYKSRAAKRLVYYPNFPMLNDVDSPKFTFILQGEQTTIWGWDGDPASVSPSSLGIAPNMRLQEVTIMGDKESTGSNKGADIYAKKIILSQEGTFCGAFDIVNPSCQLGGSKLSI